MGKILIDSSKPQCLFAFSKALFFCGEHSADCAGEKIFIRHEQFSAVKAEYVFEGLSDTDICSDAACEDNGFYEVPATTKIAFEIARQRKAKPCNDIIHRRGLLLQVNHVTFCEDGAAACHSRHAFAGQCELSKFIFYIDTETLCLLVEKRACAGSTYRIQCEIVHAH